MLQIRNRTAVVEICWKHYQSSWVPYNLFSVTKMVFECPAAHTV